MKITGNVTTGMGKARYFLSKDFYVREFIEKCGLKPYPGTLNIVIDEEFLNEIGAIKKSCENIIKPDNDFGSVKYIRATLNGEIEGAIVFPDKSTHDENYLEFIASQNLRQYLGIVDGDEVFLEF